MRAGPQARCSASAAGDAHGPRATHRVLQQVERHRIAHSQVVERGAFAKVTSVKKDLLLVPEQDPPVALANEESDDPTRSWATARLGGPRACVQRRGHTFRHDRHTLLPARLDPTLTSAARTGDGGRRRHRSPRSVAPADVPRSPSASAHRAETH
jgi:hypothetical protein